MARDVGGTCGVTLDIFHMNIEEADWAQAIRDSADHLVDFHVAENNRMPPGQGAIDWEALVRELAGVGYDGYLTVEFVATVDRSPLSERQEIADASEAGASQGMEQFLRDHGTGALPEQLLRPVRPGLDRPPAQGARRGRGAGVARPPVADAPGIALVGTLDTKGPEIAYVRDRLRALGTRPVVVDSGILGEAEGCVADVPREQSPAPAATSWPRCARRARAAPPLRSCSRASARPA